MVILRGLSTEGGCKFQEETYFWHVRWDQLVNMTNGSNNPIPNPSWYGYDMLKNLVDHIRSDQMTILEEMLGHLKNMSVEIKEGFIEFNSI